MKDYWKVFVVIFVIIIGLLFFLRDQGYVWMDFTGFEGKTIWNILELVIIPATLAGVAAILDRFERKTDREIAEKRAILDREMANQRAELDREAANKRANVDREISLDNQQEEALQNYFDAMTSLIIDKKLKESNYVDDVRDIAKIKTTTTIGRLDINRKSTLIRFLSDAGLINNDEKNQPIINLDNVSLKNVCLHAIDFNCANLMDTNLENVDLFCASLVNANLNRTNLKSSKLQFAKLIGASFIGANMEGANLEYADLEDSVGYTSEIAYMSFTSMKCANLKNATLDRAILTKVDMRKANLIEASLKDAVLNGTDLKDATYNDKTQWPTGFNPVAAGAIRVDK